MPAEFAIFKDFGQTSTLVAVHAEELCLIAKKAKRGKGKDISPDDRGNARKR